MFKLRSTTALILSAALAAPMPAVAQSGQAKKLEACGDPIEAPCLTDDGFRALKIQGQAKKLDQCPAEVTEDAVPCALTDEIVLRSMNDDTEMAEGEGEAEGEEAMAETVEGDDATMAEADTAPESGTAEEAPADTTAEAEEPVSDDTVAETAENTETENAETESSEAETVEAEELPQIEPDAEDTAEAETTPEESETTAEAESTEPEAESTDESDALPQIEPETETAEGENMQDGGDTDMANDATEGAEPAEGGDTVDAADAATGGVPADGGDATVVEDGASEAAGDDTEMAETEETTAPAPDPEVIEVSEEVEQQRREKQQERREAEATAAATSAAASAPTEGSVDSEVEVATEEVTEESARSATEDFDNSVSATSSASSDDDGLSNFEKALLIGLGAVAVGSMLDSGEEVVANSGDRVVLRDDETGQLRVLKDDDALLRQPGAQVRTERFNDGSTRTTVTREDGTQIITIRAADGRVVRRARVFSDGSQVVLFDDTEAVEPVDIASLPEPEDEVMSVDMSDEDALRALLAAAERRDLERRFSLAQVREIREVRELAPEIELEAITFATGSAAIQPSQAEELASLGRVMARIIEERPAEVFLIEGHTDAVGNAGYNLALSDRRAETVALALAEYFDVPPENMITQGYGEAQLKILTLEAERQNRRAVVRRITPLLTASR